MFAENGRIKCRTHRIIDVNSIRRITSLARADVTDPAGCIIDGDQQRSKKKVGEEIDVIRSAAQFHVAAFIIHTPLAVYSFGSRSSSYGTVQAGARTPSPRFLAADDGSHIKPGARDTRVAVCRLGSLSGCLCRVQNSPVTITGERSAGAGRSAAVSDLQSSTNGDLIVIMHFQSAF